MTKVTIHDVARHAGVSIKTVSRVLNQEPSVRQSTKEKVTEAITILNYQPNLSARNLAGARSYTIAYVYDNPNAYYIIEMQKGILSICREHGFELVIHPCDSTADDICEEIEMMIRRTNLSGLVLTPPLSEMPEIQTLLAQLDVQYIAITSSQNKREHENQQHHDHQHITIDDLGAAKDMTRYLLDMGHRQIGFISGDLDHASSHERLNGYQEALQEEGLKADPKMVRSGQYSFESGKVEAKTLLSTQPRPTAIFACNDEIAAGALFAATQLDIQVPQELSIVGFEDSPFSRQTWPSLTTCAQPTFEIAQHATRSLIRQVRRTQAQTETTKPIQHIFKPTLVLRESSGHRQDV
ncbi:LacI family DNA-binding transcriptional regulator [Algicola sagamiensis]|uniref:LacI family DNA-binding transcriptional regulator n=1 Tax=Algicola sagamiensis TaxID=163869 RepID=UPI00036F4239|nr:LacI family DNA-binding transcriptional regulator [Algicola sagamiensis]